LLADDPFFKTFVAGMSIAFAAILSTVFLGLIVRSRYSDIETSFFEAQDEALDRAVAKQSGVDQTVSDYFGSDLNPREADAASPKPKAPEQETLPSA